jgi:hypothetical protein
MQQLPNPYTQYQSPMPPPNETSRKGLWLILAAVVLVLVVISNMPQFKIIDIILTMMMVCSSIPLIGVFLLVLIINKLSKPSIHPPPYQSPAYPSYHTTSSRYIRQKTKLKVVDRDGLFCNHCGSEENLEFDHIIPFSMGGESDTANIQILCRSCNRSKGNRYSN